MNYIGIKKVEVNDGKLDIQMVDEKGILQNFINEIVKIFQQSGGINYCGWTITHKKSGEQYELIIQNKSGKTPSELKEEAENRLNKAENKLTRILSALRRNRIIEIEAMKDELIQFLEGLHE